MYLGGGGAITVVSLAGGPPRYLEGRDTTQLLADGGVLFAMTRGFLLDAMTLWRFPVTGDPGTILAGFDFDGGVPNRMALGSTDVFVADYLGYAIVRTAR